MVLQDIKQLLKAWTARDNRWLAVPCSVAALLVLLVLVKSYQGIVYYNSNECRIYRLGYPLEEAQSLASVLSDEQADSLVVRGEHDSIAYPIIKQRYFITRNFEHYLAFHKQDTTGMPLSDIVAIVNVSGFPDYEAKPCDTGKGVLMLVNGRHYLDKSYQPDSLVTISRTYCYEDQKAQPAVVEAFMAMQQECKRQTSAQLMVNSAYRSYQQQIATYNRNDKRFAARAGNSEHQTGLALDITSLQHPMRGPFDTSTEGVWMREHCHRYGFILRYPKKQSLIMSYSYEPWHLRYVGVETACRIHDEGITLDEYYAYYLEDKR